MHRNLFQKLVDAHLVSGTPEKGSEIGLRIDQTLTQDALGTMAYLQFESMGVSKVKTQLSVSYVDHLTLQVGYENSDDHKYLRTVADKHGILYSKPGNGICHQIHLERFSRPGSTLLGGDSHTPTCGAVAMLAIGAGGSDVAVAMSGGPFFLIYPKVIRVNLQGQLLPWVTAKDVILELLKKLTTKGNVNTVIEYNGPGTHQLSVPERSTLTNMGAELGVTTSLFASDDITLDFFRAQQRADEWVELLPDPNAQYDQTIDLDLSTIEPNIALPHSPDNVRKVREVAGVPVDQVLIGSCTNASYKDLMTVASMLKDRRVHPRVSFGVSAGSRQVLRMISANGALTDIVDSGARLLESACGFCAGYGQSPHAGAVSLRTNNRNFKGRSGTQDAGVYLVSPETAVAAALTGKITDPRGLNIDYPEVKPPKQYTVDDSMFVKPSYADEVFHGPNIKPPPRNTQMPGRLKAIVAVKLGDKITTDHIIPAGPVSRYRSNIPKSSEFVFTNIAPDFLLNCQQARTQGLAAVIVAGTSYGQGSSREHAALCPMHLGVRVVIAKSIERIHMANLVNFGITPLMFKNNEDFDKIQSNDELELLNVQDALQQFEFEVINRTQQDHFSVYHSLTPRQIEILSSGGQINHYLQTNRKES
ncbi:MAG: aconitate hydratase [Desulfobacterales bacterium]|jgi:aconitate hydratase